MKIRTQISVSVRLATVSLALTSMGCTGTTTSSGQETDASAVDTVTVVAGQSMNDVDRRKQLSDRITEIYSDLDIENKEERYCTKSYLKVYKSVLAADEKTGDIGFFDSDHWTSAQDRPDEPKYTIRQIEMITPEEAIVEVWEDEMNTGARLKLVWEGDNWYVDDFFSPDSVSELQQMQLHLGQS